MLTVACVLRSGGSYGQQDVAKLKAETERYLNSRFVCLSDVEVPCERIPLTENWPGWWSKIELFKLEPPVLYFDLDTLICGDLGDIAAQATEKRFTALRDFYREKGVGSGVMAWGTDMRRLYEVFSEGCAAFMGKYGSKGDQAFIEDHSRPVKWQDAVPGQIVSYKAHVRAAQNAREHGDGMIPPNARVVCLHGRPKFRDMPGNDPVRMLWEAA